MVDFVQQVKNIYVTEHRLNSRLFYWVSNRARYGRAGEPTAIRDELRTSTDSALDDVFQRWGNRAPSATFGCLRRTHLDSIVLKETYLELTPFELRKSFEFVVLSQPCSFWLASTTKSLHFVKKLERKVQQRKSWLLVFIAKSCLKRRKLVRLNREIFIWLSWALLFIIINLCVSVPTHLVDTL